MNYTSIEQSKKLVELGLNPETADMVHVVKRNDCREPWEEAAEDPGNVFTGIKDSVGMCLADYAVPCWSLGALLELMPAGCSLRSRKGFTADKKIYFCTCPFNNDDPINYNSSIEAAYNMVIWLLENNYIKAEKT